MPIFMDRHDMVDQTAQETAELHLKDLAIQDEYGVKFLTYWYDAERRTTFCLVDAPDKATADKVHAEAHGHVANEMIEVDLSAVEAFLGRVQDPPSAVSIAVDEPALRAIMFTDIVGSTETTARLGDKMAVELLKAHDGIVRRCLAQHGGTEVKHLGDGVMASFQDLVESVSSAVAIRDELETYNAKSENPIHVRIGIHAGEPIEESNDLFGSAVQLAARICQSADADTIVVSGDIKNACANADMKFAPIGSKSLKGFSSPVQLFSPAW